MAENNEQPQRKLSRGRQKVAMVKMSNESNLQVTFSKRRTGLFKKASELCTLCGAEMALVVFSPGKKVFSFGHPSVEVVLDRYAGIVGDIAAGGPTMQLIEAHRSVSLRDLNTQLAQMMSQVDSERKRSELMSRQRREAIEAQRWWEAPIDRINDEGQLRQMGRALEELKRAVSAQTDRIVLETTAAASVVAAMTGGSGRNSSAGQIGLFNGNNNNMGFGRGFF